MTSPLRLPDVVAPPPATAELPGVGGVIRASWDDFRVEEVPAYPPDDAPDGAHVFAWVEKRGHTTDHLVRWVARTCKVPTAAVGVAGKKDRHAVTLQQVSVPAEAAGRLPAIESDTIRLVGPARRHRHKLRRGHLRGNRFRITVRAIPLSPAETRRRVEAKLAALTANGGMENRFGAQRFGRDGKNAERGLALLARGRPRKGDIVVSAGQAALFNHYLLGRRRDGLLRTALAGDILKKTGTGGLFACRDPAEGTKRMRSGEAVVTGPIFGSRTMAPPEGTPASEREAETLAWGGLDRGTLARLGRTAPGSRRPILVHPQDLSYEIEEDDGGTVLRLAFFLPPGSYATCLLEELCRPAPDPDPVLLRES